MIYIRDVRAGPAGLVVVSLRLDDGAVRQIILPPRLAGVAEVEWSAKAVAMLADWQKAQG